MHLGMANFDASYVIVMCTVTLMKCISQ